MSFISKIKFAIWFANLFSSRSLHKTHWLISAVGGMTTLVATIMLFASGSWFLGISAIVVNALWSNLNFATANSVRNLKDEVVAETRKAHERPEALSKISLSSMTLANLALWCLKALQLTIAIKLFLAGYNALTSAVKEGRSTNHRATDIGKAIMWFVCIPLMFFFEFNTILEAMRGPLSYIGLYDSVSRIFNSKSDAERRDREIKLQEERNTLEREKFDWQKRKDENLYHKTNMDTMRSGNDAINSNLDGLLKIENLLKSNEPLVVEQAYRELYKRNYPTLEMKEIESMIESRMQKSRVYLGVTPKSRVVITDTPLNNNIVEDGPRFVKGTDEVVAEKQSNDNVEKQGFADVFRDSVNFVMTSPFLVLALFVTVLLFLVCVTRAIWSRCATEEHEQSVRVLFEAASGNIINSDESNNEWYEMYLEDCELLFGRIPDPIAGFDCSSEEQYLMTLATTIGQHKIDRTRLATLCANKSKHQIKTLTSFLAAHKQPKNEAAHAVKSVVAPATVEQLEVVLESEATQKINDVKQIVAQAIQKSAEVVTEKQPEQPKTETLSEPVKVDEPRVENKVAPAEQPITEATKVVTTLVVTGPPNKKSEIPVDIYQHEVEEAATENKTAPPAKKMFTCTCGKSFTSKKGLRYHRLRVGCAVPEASVTVPKNNNNKPEEKPASEPETEGKKKGGSKGQNMKKKDIAAGMDPKQKQSKDKRLKQKLSKIEQERNVKFNTYRNLKDSKAWADQQIADEIKEQLEELKRRADAYEKGVHEAAVKELEGFLRTAEMAQALAKTQKDVEELNKQLNDFAVEGVSRGARRDIPDIRVKCLVQTEKGIAYVMALPMANKLFVPLHFVLENCADIEAKVNDDVLVTSSRGLPLPTFKLGALKKVEDFTDQCYVDYQVGGMTYAPVDSIGPVKAGDKIVIRKFAGDTFGDVVAVHGDEVRNVKTKTEKGDCNALVYNVETGQLVGLHRLFYKTTGENAFTALENFPKKYLGSKPLLEQVSVLSEN